MPSFVTELCSNQLSVFSFSINPKADVNMSEFDWEEVWKTVDGDYPILKRQEE